MENQIRSHAIAVDSAKCRSLAFGYGDDAQYKEQERAEHQGGSHKSLLFAYGAENEVGVLLGNIFQLGLSAVEESLAEHAARADGYFRLIDIVAGAAKVLLDAQCHLNAQLLVRLQDVVEHIAHRE